MIQVAILDDEASFLSHFQKELKKLFQENKAIFTITAFTDPKMFLENSVQKKYDVLFLDIDMPRISGIQIASKVREQNEDIVLIFVSAHDNFVFESIRYAPYRFIRKANLLPDAKEAVSSLCKMMTNQRCQIQLTLQDQTQTSVNLSHIICFCSIRHDIFFLEEDADTSVMLSPRTYTMERLEKELADNGFIRIHRSYLVNYLHIYQIKSQKVILANKKELPLSRDRASEVKKIFQRFLSKGGSL